MLRRSAFLRCDAAAAAAPKVESSAAATTPMAAAGPSRRRWCVKIALRLGAVWAVCSTAWTAWWYTQIYRPRMQMLGVVLDQSRPQRVTKIFTTGSEPIASVSALAVETENDWRLLFYLRALARLALFGWHSLYVAWLVLRFAIKKRFASSDGGAASAQSVSQHHQSASSLPEDKKHQIQKAVETVKSADDSVATSALPPNQHQDDPALIEIGTELAEVFNTMGGAYVKLGQWSATRSDIFPKEVCDALERLFDKTTPHPWEATERTLRAAGLLDKLEHIDRNPVSSGTIAQVYRARLTTAAVDGDADKVTVMSGLLLDQRKRVNQTAQQQQQDAETATKAAASSSSKSGGKPLSASAVEQPQQPPPTLETPTDVAIKVVHPRIRSVILEDMQALHWATQLINLLVPGASYLGMTNAVEEFAGLLYSQLDLLREAENLNEFRFNFRTSESVVFPRPFLSLTTPDVLVETFEYGVALNSSAVAELTGLEATGSGMMREIATLDAADGSKKAAAPAPKRSKASPVSSVFASLTAAVASWWTASSYEHPPPHSQLSWTSSPGGPGIIQQPLLQKSDYADLGPLAIEMFLKMVFEHNLVHGDLHPGNILVRIVNADGSYSLSRRGPHSHSQVVVLDPGLVTSMSARERNNFIALFTCVATGDGDLGAKLMLERSPEQQCADVPRYMRDMKLVFERVTPRGLTIEDLDLATIMREVLDTMRQHRVRIDMNFASLAATVALGESLGRKLVPSFNLFEEAMPFLLNCLEKHELKFLMAKLIDMYRLN